MNYKVFSDGGARGNPGPAATGYLIKNENNDIVATGGTYLGKKTNNYAEYSAVIEAFGKLKNISGEKADSVEFFVDSQLVAHQLNGVFKVKNSQIRELVFKVRELESNFSRVSYTQIGREKNQEADKIVNQILDKEIYGI